MSNTVTIKVHFNSGQDVVEFEKVAEHYIRGGVLQVRFYDEQDWYFYPLHTINRIKIGATK